MSGMLSFKYPRPLSKLREEFLVTYLDNQVVAELKKTESLLTAHLIPLPIKGKNVGKEVHEIFKAYAEILLPITKKQAKIEDISNVDLKAIGKTLRQLNKNLKKKSTK